MASLLHLKTKSGGNCCQIFRTKNIVELERKKERDAAVKIHSWFRKIQVQRYIRNQHACATIIQKTFRAYIGRKYYREAVRKRMKGVMTLFYDQMATKIQAKWRGYYARKYRFNFYTRKTYLDALVLKNERIRVQLQQTGLKNKEKEEKKRKEQEMNAEIMKHRRRHYLLSTQVCPGVYNSFNKSNIGIEDVIKSLPPLSRQERQNIQKEKRLKFLKTANGIPTSLDSNDTNGQQASCDHPTLPPLKSKPQGPFRCTEEVLKQRYKELKPTLRVATDYESVNKARFELRKDEWTRRIIDKKFLPSTKREATYTACLHTSSNYQRPDYGSKHFRESDDKGFIQNKTFQRVVSPIPIFDQLGKTY